MPVIALTTPLFTDTPGLLDSLRGIWNCRVYGDEKIIAKAARDHQISPDLLTRVVQVCPIAYNNFTHEREKGQAALAKTLVDLMAGGDCIFSGITCHLIPHWVSHVFRILVLTGSASRIGYAVRCKGYSKKEAKKKCNESDHLADQWVREITASSMWDEALYDLVLNLDGKGQNAAALIQSAVSRPPYADQKIRKKQMADLSITVAVQLALAPLGGGLKVSADAGHVIVTIEKRRMNLPQTQSEIMISAKNVPGVVSVKTRIGTAYYKSEIIKAFDFGPSTGGP